MASTVLLVVEYCARAKLPLRVVLPLVALKLLERMTSGVRARSISGTETGSLISPPLACNCLAEIDPFNSGEVAGPLAETSALMNSFDLVRRIEGHAESAR